MTYSTRITWDGREHVVELRNGAQLVAQMSLDDWLALSATRYLVREALDGTLYAPGITHPEQTLQ